MRQLGVSPIEFATDGIWPFPTPPNSLLGAARFYYYYALTQLYEYDSEAVWDAAKQEVAAEVFAAIRDDKLYIITHPEMDGILRERFANIMARENPVGPAARLTADPT